MLGGSEKNIHPNFIQPATAIHTDRANRKRQRKSESPATSTVLKSDKLTKHSNTIDFSVDVSKEVIFFIIT